MSRNLTTRFDQEPGEPYGVCSTCGDVLPDDVSTNEHLSAAVGHRVRITNPTRQQQIRSFVRREMTDVLDDLVCSLAERMAQTDQPGDYTAAELKEALGNSVPDDIIGIAIQESDYFDEYDEREPAPDGGVPA